MEKAKLKKLSLKIGLGLLIFLFILAFSAEFTSRPSFCPTCHYMEPFYESWKTSTHKDVTCVKCHFPPGLAGTVRGKLEGLVQVVNYFARSYTKRKPWAEISDESCLQSGCHETRLLKGRVIYKGVVFDHGPHLEEMRRGKKLRCTSCHSQIVQGEHITVTETTCFLCHFKRDGDVEFAVYKKLSNCQTCHHWESIPKEEMSRYRFDHSEVINRKIDCTRCHVSTVIGDGFVPRENCYSCHFDHARLSQYGNTELLHRVHIAEHKIECIQCHLTIQHKVRRISPDEELECKSCHIDEHKNQVLLFAGKDLNGLKGHPNPMFEAGLECASCHVFHEELIGKAKVKVAKPQSCEVCHGKGYAKLLVLWEESADKKIEGLKRQIQIVDSLVDVPSAKTLIEKAKSSVLIVESGKAVHNITYSDQIISKGYEYLAEALKIAKVNYNLPKFFASSKVPSECANCHTGIENISKAIYGTVFSHAKHVQENGLKCNTCHSNARKHGELVLTKDKCNSCHHQKQTAQDCKSCHKISTEIYYGTFMSKMSPDVMNQAGIECVDCHVVNAKVIKPDETICLNCHDSGYDKMALEWKNEVRKLISEVKRLSQNYEGKDRSEILGIVSGIEKWSASGIHNYNLVTEVLRDIKRRLTPQPIGENLKTY
ncbi:Class III cytochrome C family protein [Candidatus Kryptonium thompsonii]|uniref:Class III cytochrome C family protein n=2 Tax=Candidatus Kryptonium thompsonii TaxID=1633631 RepID=A0A0P1LA60_9BACT|nr:cytochrome c3 family protein [Candidatus Kryptonium thompsoni]CUS77937.1 Class III cytochrome C family protein [Candidatus Kryptonium thompsoni]CUS79720.1 Class III cytochrome C family protein [Candidatus Kryptonium thompsoni]CUS87187.1 Class III cytochrome C family protein [Candidatus Kryptonium thompsoni]CUS90069.1 Class III cytochrome C family protein [Candidatus Kryptonium thompsoni]CUS91488.1 Class III cytochrome C family protein [Candidatus Kryptonium thompsoni]